jgi:diphthine synthase
MLYLIGLGLNEKSISLEGIEAIKKCKKIYLENYTVEFPYLIKDLNKILRKKIIELERKDVESDKLIKEAKKENIALLVYGSPLFATTHISLIMDCKKAKVNSKIIFSASVFDAVAETGLQLYKFGKISSMPKWENHFHPDSFLEFAEQNNSIGAHSLILIDPGLKCEDALNELEISCKKRGFDLDKILICSNLGEKRTGIFYGNLNDLRKKCKKVSRLFCFIIPGNLHFFEKEVIDKFET